MDPFELNPVIAGVVAEFGAEEQYLGRLYSEFEGGELQNVEGDKVRYDSVTMPRAPAPFAARDGAFPHSDRPDEASREVTLADIKLSVTIEGSRLVYDRGLGKLAPDAESVLKNAIRGLMKRIMISKEYLAERSLEGSAVVSAATIPGSTVAFTIAYAINTYAATNGWQLPGTKILSDELTALKADFLQTSGMEPARVICGQNVMGWLGRNEELKYNLRTERGAEIVEAGAKLFGSATKAPLMGLDFEVNEAGYTPPGGTFTRFISGSDKAIVLPRKELMSDVVGNALGRGMIPGSPDVTSLDGASALVAKAPGYGFYGYACRSGNPKTNVDIYVGWRGLPYLRFASGVMLADLVP